MNMNRLYHTQKFKRTNHRKHQPQIQSRKQNECPVIKPCYVKLDMMDSIAYPKTYVYKPGCMYYIIGIL